MEMRNTETSLFELFSYTMIRYWNSEALKQQPSAFLLEEIPYKERRL
jgi:hypothetical protein